MKHKIFTASLLALSLLTTGCGGTANTDNTGTNIASSEESGTEATYTEAVTPLVTSEVATTFTTSSQTSAPEETAAPTSEPEVQTSPKSTETQQHTQADTQQIVQQQPEQHNTEPTVIVTQVLEETPTVSTTVETSTTAITVTTPVTTLPATTTSFRNNPLPKEVLDNMTLKEKVCQMFIVTPEALTGISPMTQVGEGTQNAIEDYPVGGIIYFAKNLTSKEQTRQMISTTQNFAREACGIGLFTAVDEEGGQVARCAQKLGTTKFESMAHYGKLNDKKTAYNVGSTIAKDLKGLGFNVDFAPVADINICSANELGDRIFSSDPQVVADMASYVTLGLQDEGVCAALKHFPGLGAEKGNTHTNSTVVIDRTLDELRDTEFIPFSEGIKVGADFVLVGHQIVTGFGDDLPCDLSYTAVTGMLRKELGFEGIAITDSQQMNTISNVYTSGEAAKLSIKAGIDIILMPVDYREAVNAVCEAVRNGEISEKRINESVMRILRKKYALGLLKK